jgi:hypothetical protein
VRTLLLLALGAAVLAAFLVVEARSRTPMVPLTLFRSRTFAGTNLLTLLLYAGLGGCLFFVPFDLIQVQGYSPTAAGAAWLPFIVLVAAMSRWAGGLGARLGARLLLVGGPLVAAGGFALLAVPEVGGSYWSTFFPGIVVLGLGMGLTVAPLTSSVMGAVEPRHAGLASGINNAISRAAGLLAIAALGVLLVARFNAALDRALAGIDLPADVVATVTAERTKLAAAEVPPTLHEVFLTSYVAGFRAVMIVSSALAALGAFFAFVFIEPRPNLTTRPDLPERD